MKLIEDFLFGFVIGATLCLTVLVVFTAVASLF
jgi:hypothetical protein